MRIVLVIACALALGGCNFVFSKQPLFTEADTRGAPQLRPGLWAKPDEGCPFDSAKPLKDWPGCAGAMLVRPDRLENPEGGGKPVPYLIAAGDPPVLQVPFDDDPKRSGYVYGGIRLTKRDSAGRGTELVSWIAQCGPPPPAPKPGEKRTYVTQQPLPGLVVDEAAGMCIASDADAVRRAVKASEAWMDKAPPAVWIRDGVP